MYNCCSTGELMTIEGRHMSWVSRVSSACEGSSLVGCVSASMLKASKRVNSPSLPSMLNSTFSLGRRWSPVRTMAICRYEGRTAVGCRDVIPLALRCSAVEYLRQCIEIVKMFLCWLVTNVYSYSFTYDIVNTPKMFFKMHCTHDIVWTLKVFSCHI